MQLNMAQPHERRYYEGTILAVLYQCCISMIAR